MGLLLLVYYRGELLVTADAAVSSGRAAAFGLGPLVLGWLVYDLLFARAGRAELPAAVVGYLLLAATGFGLSQRAERPRRLDPRRRAARDADGRERLDADHSRPERDGDGDRAKAAPPTSRSGERAKQRSKHNTFMVVPLLLIMLSNHFPTLTYGHRHTGLAWC